MKLIDELIMKRAFRVVKKLFIFKVKCYKMIKALFNCLDLSVYLKLLHYPMPTIRKDNEEFEILV